MPFWSAIFGFVIPVGAIVVADILARITPAPGDKPQRLGEPQPGERPIHRR